MRSKVFLDNVEVSTPDGLDGLGQELFYDDELKGMFLRIDNDLTFSGDGYDAIEAVVFNQGLCNQIEFLLQIGNPVLKDYFEGIIHVVDITEMNVSRKTVKTPIEDNNASSYIINNRNTKAYINAAYTKSGDTGTSATKITGFDFFIPSTGVYSVSRDNVYTVDEAFAFLVDFMSDGNMTYSSTFFGSGGEQEGLVIADATHIADNSDRNPYLSFYELFTEMDKLFNISFYIDYSGALPKIVIEQTDDLYSSTALMTFSDVKDVIINFDKEKFYSYIDIGSETTQDYEAGTFTMPDSNFLGFKQEKYYIVGQCNMDRGLNLVNSFIIDSNVIEDLVVNGITDYEDKVVIIESDAPGTNQATQYDNIITGGTFIYNKGLTNYEKSLNYLGAIPNDMVLFITAEANNFEATKSAYTITAAKIVHDTVVTDPGTNYDNILGRFTCPVAAEGGYSFSFSYTGLFYTGTLGGTAGSIYLKHFDSGGVLLETQTLLTFTHTIVIIDFGGATGAFSLTAGDYVEVWGTTGVSTTSFTGSTFRGNYIGAEGGTYQTYDPNAIKVMNLNFSAPITQTQFENIRDNVTRMVTVETADSQTFYGWVKNLKRNILTGMSEITLRTSNILSR